MEWISAVLDYGASGELKITCTKTKPAAAAMF
jgi:hypothetical protein